MLQTPFVLSGGGARGFAHVGVLKALEEIQIVPSAIAATSAGALVGAFIADGYKPDEVKELVLHNIRLGYLFDLRNIRSSIFQLSKMAEFMRKNLRHQLLEDMLIPFYPTATNFINGSQHIFRQGDIVEAVIAACSIPAMFPPVVINGIPYVDGGLTNNLPVQPFEDRKSDVIAVYVNPIAPFDPKHSANKVIDRAMHLSFKSAVDASAKGCRLYIEPFELHQFSLFDVKKLTEIYETGYNYVHNNTFINAPSPK